MTPSIEPSTPHTATTDGASLYAQLAAEHRELIRARRRNTTGKEPGVSERDIRRYCEKAQAAGATIADEDERHRVQSFLDYWTAELISSAETQDPDFRPWVLAPFVEGAPPQASVGFMKARDWNMEARQQVRLAALARQWQESGGAKGYLLTGKALEQAAEYGHDPDIGKLVQASETAALAAALDSRRRSRIAIVVLLSLVALLCGALFFMSKALKDAEVALDKARVARLNADSAQEDADVLRSERLQLADVAEDYQRKLDQAAAVINKAVQENRPIDPARLPATVQAVVESVRKSPIPPSEVPKEELSGYLHDFIGYSIPLPKLARQVADDAFEGGAPIHYVNYSVVLHAKRRLPIYTASNLDRAQRVFLRGVASEFALDRRVPSSVQPDPAWFNSRKLDRGHLVTRQEIAWGKAFDSRSPDAAAKLSGMVDVYTNATPQFAEFNSGVWATLERWVQSEHNKSAERIAIFTGPVLTDDDPLFEGVRVPRSFWKIAASSRIDGALVVDAFLIPHERTRIEFKPDVYRIDVKRIEQLTGLDFVPALRGETVLKVKK